MKVIDRGKAVLKVILELDYDINMIVWNSSDKGIATVDQQGAVYVKKAGTAVITALSDNGLEAVCRVEVSKCLWYN